MLARGLPAAIRRLVGRATTLPLDVLARRRGCVGLVGLRPCALLHEADPGIVLSACLGPGHVVFLNGADKFLLDVGGCGRPGTECGQEAGRREITGVDILRNGGLWREYAVLILISPLISDDGNITHYVATQVDVTDKKVAEDRIQRLAFYDQLTNLPNRSLLVNHLERALLLSNRNKRFGGLLFMADSSLKCNFD